MKAINVLRMRKAGSSALGTLSTTETTGSNTDSTTYWVRGFVAATSTEFGETAAAIGSLGSTALGVATVVGTYWRSTISFTGNGLVTVEVTGNRSAGAVNTFSVSGVDQGTVGAPTFNAGTNTTSFQFGSAKANPFGAGGSTPAIVIT
jgi:hypothetical protein